MFLLNPWTYQFDWMFLNPITPLLNISVYQSDLISLKQCQPALGQYWISESIGLTAAIIWLQPLSSVLSEVFWVIDWIFLSCSIRFHNFIVNKSDWICLNQCQPALGLYWISESINLAAAIHYHQLSLKFSELLVDFFLILVRPKFPTQS